MCTHTKREQSIKLGTHTHAQYTCIHPNTHTCHPNTAHPPTQHPHPHTHLHTHTHTCTHNKQHPLTHPHNTPTQHTPVFVVAVLWLCVVQDVLPGPAGGLFPTQQQAQLVRSEHAESLHWKHLVKAIYSTMWHTHGGSHSYISYGQKFWQEIYLGRLAVLRAIWQYFICQNFTV